LQLGLRPGARWDNLRSTHGPHPLQLHGGNSSFHAASGPRVQNSPMQLRNLDITYGLLRRQLKRHLFGNHEHSAL